MKRALIPTTAFVRATKRMLRKNPSASAAIALCLEQMERDVFDPALRTHKLKGVLENSWASSAGHDLRVIFSFVKHEGREAVLLESAGTHDAVY